MIRYGQKEIPAMNTACALVDKWSSCAPEALPSITLAFDRGYAKTQMFKKMAEKSINFVSICTEDTNCGHPMIGMSYPGKKKKIIVSRV